MAGSYVSARKEVMALLRTEGKAIVERNATAILRNSQQMVPQGAETYTRTGAVGAKKHWTAAGQKYATGALAVSGYVATAKDGGRNYAEAIGKADALNPRIEERDQVMPPVVIDPPKDVFEAAVAYPLEYAILIHDGFHHVRGGYRVFGVPFLADAAANQWGQLLSDVRDLIGALCELSPTDKAAKQAQKQLAYEAGQLASANAAYRQHRRDVNEAMRAKFGAGIFGRESGRTMGESAEMRRDLEQEMIQLGELFD